MKSLVLLLAVASSVLAVGELTGSGPLLLGGRDAHAVVGRPLTPMSYAGVARRTTRRTYRRNAAYAGATVATLPAGCALAGGIYTCGAVRYQPYYDGPNLVYVVVQ